jgi:hypothetical protein
VVRELAAARQEDAAAVVPPGPPAEPAPPRFAPPPPTAPLSTAEPRRAEPTSVAERIAPRRRSAAEGTGAEPAPAPGEPLLPSAPRREPAQPRGRFAQVAPYRPGIDDLKRTGERSQVEALLAQHADRFALLRALQAQYTGPRGAPLQLADVEGLLESHGLLGEYAGRERVRVLGAYVEQRGAAGRVAWALGLSPAELQRLVAALGVGGEVEEVRERFRREALASRQLGQRLDLLGRTKYLVDLGIKRRFEEALQADLREVLLAEAAHAADLASLAERVGRLHAAPGELVLRAAERLGLADEVRARLGPAPHAFPTPPSSDEV